MVTRSTEKIAHLASSEIGPRGGRKVFIDVWRVSGKMQTWKTRPGEFSIPIKWGFYGPSAYLTHLSASYFHLANDCPQRVKIEEERQITKSQADDDGNDNVGGL